MKNIFTGSMDFIYRLYIYIFLFFIFMLNMIFATEEVLVSIGLFLFLNFVFFNLRSFFVKFIDESNKVFYEELFNPIKAVNKNAESVLAYYNLEFKIWNLCYSIMKIKISDELEHFHKVEGSFVKGELLLLFKVKKLLVNYVRNYYYLFYFNFLKYNFDLNLRRLHLSWSDTLPTLKSFVESNIWLLNLSSYFYGYSRNSELLQLVPLQNNISNLSWYITYTMFNNFLKEVRSN
jgi:hypothetical protein